VSNQRDSEGQRDRSAVRLTVIIPCFNAADTIADQLDALTRQQWSERWEVLLVDNRSTDESREVVEGFKARLPNLRIVDASERQGTPYAVNTGVKEAKGEHILICDADDEVATGWLSAMGDALSAHEFIACKFETRKLNPPWLQGHEQERGLQTIWYPPWLTHAGGGTFGFRKRMFQRVGGFDESLPHLNDTDFCFRAQMMGYQLHFVPEAAVHVRKRHNLRGHYLQSRNYAEYNVVLAKRYWDGSGSAASYRRKFLRDWVHLIRKIRKLSSQRGRFWWIWLLGRQVGRTRGILFQRGIPV